MELNVRLKRDYCHLVIQQCKVIRMVMRDNYPQQPNTTLMLATNNYLLQPNTTFMMGTDRSNYQHFQSRLFENFPFTTPGKYFQPMNIMEARYAQRSPVYQMPILNRYSSYQHQYQDHLYIVFFIEV